MKRIIFFVLVFINVLCFICYASFKTSPQSKYSWPNITRTDEYYYNDLILTERTRDVKFTQDDDYYYFDITQYVGDYFGTSWNTPCEHYNAPDVVGHAFGSANQVVFAPFSNINQLHYYYKRTDRDVSCNLETYFDLGSTRICTEKYVVSSSGKVTTDTRTCNYTFWADGNLYEKTGEVGTHIAPYTYNFSCYNISAPSQGERNNKQYYESLYFNLHYKVKIKKNEIDNFRYCMPTHPIYAHYTYTSSSGSTTGWTGSLSSAIDLKAYIDCEHNWVYKDKVNRDKHTRYCEYCEWEIPENHEYVYEYDGLDNNRCVCGNNKNVYIIIKDNIGKINERFLTTPSEVLSPVVWEDVGYDFLYVDDKELVYNDINNCDYVVASISSIPIVVPDNSHEYDIYYYIHKYYINYKKKNAYDLELKNDMPKKEVCYGDEVKLDKTLYNVTGYTFLGWGVEPNIDEVIFKDEQEIINISDVDGYELNIYPVYDPYKYIVRFTPGRGYGYMSDQICTYGVCEDIKGYQYHLDDEATFLNWYYKGVDIKPNVTTTLERFVNKNGALIVLDSRVYVRERNEKAGYENSPTKKPDRSRIKTEIGPGVSVGKTLVENSLAFDIKGDINIDDRSGVAVDKDLENVDESTVAYLMVASNSTIFNGGKGEKAIDNAILRGVLLAANIVLKMAFCVIIILTVLIFLIILGGKRYTKKLALNT